MTRITQISAAAILAVFASTAFVSTVEAEGKKVWCEQTSSKLFKTACEDEKRRKIRQTFPQPQAPVKVVNNFRGRSDAELGARSLNGGESGGGGGQAGKR